MPFFKLKCQWYEVREKQKFWNDKKPQKYHRLFVVNYRELPSEYLNSREGVCSIGITDGLVQNIKVSFKMGVDYQFIVKLGEPNTARFKHKVGLKGSSKKGDNNMVLKNKEYFENTVQKIGFGDSENYFYESKKGSQKPSRKQNNSPSQPENKNGGGKIALICLPILAIALFSFLIIKGASKKNKN